MITLFILLAIMGVLLFVVMMGCTILLDPIIAILVIYGVYRLIKKLVFRKKK